MSSWLHRLHDGEDERNAVSRGKLPVKKFTVEFPGIKKLENYMNEPGKEFWNDFPENKNLRGGSPYKLKTEVLKEYVEQVGSPFALTDLLREVTADIEAGADLKVNSDYEWCTYRSYISTCVG